MYYLKNHFLEESLSSSLLHITLKISQSLWLHWK